MPINPSLTDGEVDRQLDASSARLLVTERTTSAHTGVATLAVHALNHCLGWEDLPAPPDPSALALLIYSSGSTGTPEGVMLDHAAVGAMATTGRDALELGSADRCLLTLPLFDVNGIVVGVLAPLLAGARIAIPENPSARSTTRSIR